MYQLSTATVGRTLRTGARATGLGLLMLAALGVTSTYAQGERRAPVRVITATEAPIQRVLPFVGSVTALRAASLSVATNGLVAELHVDAGHEVRRGDLLLRMDDELARYQLQRDEAAERRAQQALADAQRRLREAKELSAKQTIAETTVRDLASEVIEDEAELARARAVAGLSQATLERHELKAPFDGVISARAAEVGEWVTTGSAVFDLISLDELRVDVQVSEAYLGVIRAGTELQVRFAGDEVRSYPARVSSTVPVTDLTARTFLVRVALDDNPEVMLPGVSATTIFSLATGRQRVTIPRDAVLRFSDGRSVAWVIDNSSGNPVARERLLETGLSFEGRIEVRSGLSAGELVVVAGNEALRDGQAVRLLPNDS